MKRFSFDQVPTGILCLSFDVPSTVCGGTYKIQIQKLLRQGQSIHLSFIFYAVMLNDKKYHTSVAACISIFGVMRGTECISSSFSVTVYLEFYNKKEWLMSVKR